MIGSTTKILFDVQAFCCNVNRFTGFRHIGAVHNHNQNQKTNKMKSLLLTVCAMCIATQLKAQTPTITFGSKTWSSSETLHWNGQSSYRDHEYTEEGDSWNGIARYRDKVIYGIVCSNTSERYDFWDTGGHWIEAGYDQNTPGCAWQQTYYHDPENNPLTPNWCSEICAFSGRPCAFNAACSLDRTSESVYRTKMDNDATHQYTLRVYVSLTKPTSSSSDPGCQTGTQAIANQFCYVNGQQLNGSGYTTFTWYADGIYHDLHFSSPGEPIVRFSGVNVIFN